MLAAGLVACLFVGKPDNPVKVPRCTLHLSSTVSVRLATPGGGSVIVKDEEGCPEAPMKDFYMCPGIRCVQQNADERAESQSLGSLAF